MSEREVPIIEGDRRPTVVEICVELGISYVSVQSIIKNELQFRKISALLWNPVYDSPLSLLPVFYAHICSPSYIIEKYILIMINKVF
jgi:hypothetical protein